MLSAFEKWWSELHACRTKEQLQYPGSDCDLALAHIAFDAGMRIGRENNATMRDEFAMAALTGLMATADSIMRADASILIDGNHRAVKDCANVSRLAYQLADTMMKARGTG